MGQSVFDARTKEQAALTQKLLNSTGDQNPYVIQKELGKTMSDNCHDHPDQQADEADVGAD